MIMPRRERRAVCLPVCFRFLIKAIDTSEKGISCWQATGPGASYHDQSLRDTF